MASLQYNIYLLDDGRCRVDYRSNGESFRAIENMTPDSQDECIAYAFNLVGLTGTPGAIGQTCSIEETDIVIASVKSLIQPFLMTELVIVVAVVVMRILKQMRPI